MSYNHENSTETKNVIYNFSSVSPIERQIELRNLLDDFPEDWNILFINLYPLEVKKILNKFPNFEITVLNEKANVSTIFCRICRILN